MTNFLRPLSPEEQSAILLSFRVASASALLSTPIAITLGWLFARKNFIGKPLLESLIHIPMVLPPVTVGYLLLHLFGIKGLIGAPLYHYLGLRLAFNTQAAILAAIIVSLPLYIRSVRLAIQLADPKYEEAARTLGSSPWHSFKAITLPLALPGILSGALLAFSRSLGEFGATIILAGNISGETQTIPLAIYSLMQSPGGEEGAMRLALISVTISILTFTLSESYARKKAKDNPWT